MSADKCIKTVFLSSSERCCLTWFQRFLSEKLDADCFERTDDMINWIEASVKSIFWLCWLWDEDDVNERSESTDIELLKSSELSYDINENENTVWDKQKINQNQSCFCTSVDIMIHDKWKCLW